MNRSKTLPLGMLAMMTLASPIVMAEDYECSEIEKCLDVAYTINGSKYYSSKKLKGKIEFSQVKLNKNNVDQIISSVLFDHGYSRISEGEGLYRIINSRDLRYNTVPLIEASKDVNPKLPNNHDYYMMEYKLEHPSSSRIITKNLRPFLSRYGRVVSPDGVDRILIQDSAKNLNRVYKLITHLDQKIDKEVLRKVEKREQRHHALKLASTRNCSHEKLQ